MRFGLRAQLGFTIREDDGCLAVVPNPRGALTAAHLARRAAGRF